MPRSIHPQGRLGELDRLRAVAVLMVMIVHFPSFRKYFPWLAPQSGVDLFFAISGYIVSRTFIPGLDRALHGPHVPSAVALQVKAFLTRRVFRIMPPLLLNLAVYAIIDQSFRKLGIALLPFDLAREIFSVLTYTYHFYQARIGGMLGWHWSLSIEEQFYLIFPFFLIFAKTWRARLIIIGSLLLLMTFLFRPWSHTGFFGGGEPSYLPQFRADGLLYGVLAYFVTTRSWWKEMELTSLAKSPVLALVLSGALVSAIALAPTLSLGPVYSQPIIGIASFLLMLLTSWERNVVLSLGPFNRALQWIGLRSYGLYLFHGPAIRFMQALRDHLAIKYQIMTPYAVYFPLTLLVMFGGVALSFHFIEKPLMNFGAIKSREILGALPK
jgi:peptidoglycan/LPS O-acetylase OafA/YrhL